MRITEDPQPGVVYIGGHFQLLLEVTAAVRTCGVCLSCNASGKSWRLGATGGCRPDGARIGLEGLFFSGPSSHFSCSARDDGGMGRMAISLPVTVLRNPQPLIGGPSRLAGCTTSPLDPAKPRITTVVDALVVHGLRNNLLRISDCVPPPSRALPWSPS